MPRIVSLIASATEIVCALGLEDSLVGRSHECDHPESIRRLPGCTEPKFNVDGTSYEIDQRVKAIVQEGLSVYRVDAGMLRQLEPDVIVTQSQCEVCAVSEREVENAVDQWLGRRPHIVSLAPNSLEDVWADIDRTAQALGVADRGRELVTRLQSRMQAVAAKAQASPTRPTVVCIEWIDPLMAAGNWMPQLVTMAGGENLFGVAGEHAPWMTWEQLRERDPDVIVVMPCGFDISRTRREMPVLVSQPGWSDLRAVRNHCVFLTDGNQYFNRPGPRLVESLEILAKLIHPEAFSSLHEGTGWIAFS
jgi:iron complex transport system substrate-binding protein